MKEVDPVTGEVRWKMNEYHAEVSALAGFNPKDAVMQSNFLGEALGGKFYIKFKIVMFLACFNFCRNTLLGVIYCE